jgi:hypothetical protein
MAAAMTLEDLLFGDYSLNNTGNALFGAETVGSDLANTLLGGPAQGGSYTGGVGGGSSRTEAERQQSILDVNPYVRPGENINLDPIASQRNAGQTGYYFANELGLPASYGNVGQAQAANPATFNPNAQYASQLPGFVPVDPNATYRLVSGGTGGDVVYSGAGADGLRNVFQQANDLTLADPRNAYWGVEVLDPATGEYRRVAENRGPNGLGIIGDIAGFALPIAAAIATGGASLGVQIAAGAAAGGLGGFLSGNDILRSALLAGATAGLGNVTGLNEAVGGVLNDVGGAVSDAFSNAFASGAANQAVSGATGDIVVNALSNLAQGAGAGVVQGAVGGAVGGATGATGTGGTSTGGTSTGTTAGDTIVVTGARPGAILDSATGAVTGAATGGLLNAATGTGGTSTGTTADDTIVVTGNQTTGAGTGAATTAGTGGLLNTTTGTGTTGDIVVTGNRTTGAGTGAATTAGTGGLLNTAGTTGDIVVTGNRTTGGNTGAATTAGTSGLLNTTTGADTIIVTGNRPGAVTDTATGAVTNAAGTGLLNTATGNTTTSERGGVLGTGLTIGEILSILGVGGNLIGNLVGGSGGTGTTSTYVSPFGTGTGLATGQDMRANPNITDYERYGFGPEAMFFTPGYSSVFSAGTPATQAAAAMTTNPARTTLI